MATEIATYGREEREIYDAPDYDSYYGSPRTERLVERFETLLERVDVCSFDVFDTVLQRDGRSELERFGDVAAEFVRRAGREDPELRLSQRTCLSARVLSASTAYQMSPPVKGCREGRFPEIVQNLVASLSLPGDPYERLWREAEFEIEAAQLRGAPFIENLIDLAVARGKTVIFISDMYLPGEDIARLVEACGIGTGKVARIFSSADTVVSKRSGLLYDHVCAELEVAPGKMLHLGDSLEGDFIAAKRRGLEAIHLPVPRALMQKRLESHRSMLAGLAGEDPLPLPIGAPVL
ncbi:HAD family hydrolase [Poseidonocella sp. HB161398]|uniref:HAD family hydrolase n=1 Tax=Poseidonocella sp. HB161398 TaxID=2320855 RepID=UPI00110804F2|nr:HAD family hydrolase [Poseidonocella sp. HB161398]